MRDGEAALGICVVDRIPAFESAQRDGGGVGEEVHAVPEEKVREAEDEQQPGGFRSHAREAGDGDEDEEADNRGEIVELEGGEEIDAEREQERGEGHPKEAE